MFLDAVLNLCLYTFAQKQVQKNNENHRFLDAGLILCLYSFAQKRVRKTTKVVGFWTLFWTCACIALVRNGCEKRRKSSVFGRCFESVLVYICLETDSKNDENHWFLDAGVIMCLYSFAQKRMQQTKKIVGSWTLFWTCACIALLRNGCEKRRKSLFFWRCFEPVLV